MNYLFIFTLSNLLEMPAYLTFLKNKNKSETLIKSFLFITALNALTHPFVFFGIMNLERTYLENILMAEAFAIIVEAILINRIGKIELKKCFFISFFANLLSWQISPIITYGLNEAL